MTYKLFLDDERQPPDETWRLARTVQEAKDLVLAEGTPDLVSFDHDLGGDETSMQFLRWMTEHFYESPPRQYLVHSANPVGRENIIALMESWRRSLHR